jgi:outer membrane protein assembly factor BamB
VAVGDVIAAGSNGRAIGYGARTGKVLWTVHGLPATTMLTEADGLILVQSDVEGGAGDPTAVTALEPRTGRVAWRFDSGAEPQIMGAGSAGIVMATFNPDGLYLVNQATGRARWSAATFAAALEGNAAQMVTAGGVVQLEGRGVPHLVSRRATDGKVLWSKALTGVPDGANLALTSGSDVVVTLGPAGGGTLNKPNTVSRLWVFRLATGDQTGFTKLPTLVQAPLATTGADTVAQLDDGVCAVPLTGTR